MQWNTIVCVFFVWNNVKIGYFNFSLSMISYSILILNCDFNDWHNCLFCFRAHFGEKKTCGLFSHWMQLSAIKWKYICSKFQSVFLFSGICNFDIHEAILILFSNFRLLMCILKNHYIEYVRGNYNIIFGT